MSTKHTLNAVRSSQHSQRDHGSSEIYAALDAERRPSGFWHGPISYVVMCIAAAVGLFASLMLAADTLKLARNPNKALGCDISSVLSCSRVADSPQAEIVKFGGLSFPNAFFGIAVFSVFVTVAVVGMCRIMLPRWFAFCTWAGCAIAILYSYWLFTQSMFVIKALCPWCMTMMFASTIMFMACSHATVTMQHMPREAGWLNTYYRMRYDLMLDIVWILAIIALIFVKEGAAIFS
ncbi:Uncharacterized membrane protein [Bifidobacterium bohemicum]|uniref:Vitamin K epoxide reductase family protein n=1 Tax=Bifidobacterium bohemicum DSM 22767 TaxID=1437606 RepID=A0A086ZGK3_9BIFI|nr:vitamin K epoxide reductase family protein [Bifidobacterium bohemicum DSM 22767]SCB99491.1 Uncharacterized membrane protein [Bifidobacterium bohemicum]